MDNYCPPILYISSDEESAFGDSGKNYTTTKSGGFYDREDHDWLSELLGEVDRKTVEDDCDEVVLVSEMIPTPKRPRLKRLEPCDEIVIDSKGDGQDDDCVILDYDPYQTRAVKKGRVESPDGNCSDDSNDLQIVGEKGEVACRDFPHCRHLCANFSFDSTPHEVHCSQCHCYVCDSTAPCAHWGSGTSSSDHCHASDKEKFWRSERKRLREYDKPVSVLHGVDDVTFSAGLPQGNQISTYFPPLFSSLQKNQCSRPVAVRPYSMSTNIRVPNALNQKRNHMARRPVPISHPRPQFVSRGLSPACHRNFPLVDSNTSPMSRGHRNIHLPSSKGPGYVVAPDRPGYNKSYHGSQLSRDPSLKRCHTLQTPVSNGSYGFNHRQNMVQHATNSMTYRPKVPTQQSMNTGSAKYINSQSPMHQPQMAYKSRVSNRLQNAVAFSSPVASPSHPKNLEDMFRPQLDKAFQPNIPIPPLGLMSEQPGVGIEYKDKINPTPVMSFHQNFSYSMPTSSMINDQPGFQLSQIPCAGVQSLTDFDNISRSHDYQRMPLEIPLLQSTIPADNFQHPIMTEKDRDQSIESTGVVDDFAGSINPDSLNFEFDGWNFEDEDPSYAVAIAANPSSNPSVFSAEHALHATSLFDL